MMNSLNNKLKLTMQLKPKWAIRSVLFSLIITLGIYWLLPYLEMLSNPPERNISLRTVDTAEIPPASPPPPKRTQTQKNRPKQETPKPKLQQPRRQLPLLQANLNLSMAIGDVGGDFALDFQESTPEVVTPELAQKVQQMIFELDELDEPPGVLARFQPIYPPQARMRRLEGLVELEFIILQSGKIKDIKVISSQPGDIFNKSAIQCIQRWRFSPGTKDGILVQSRVRQKIIFKLN